MNLPESQKLEIKYLSRLFDNMSESYKIFWFQAIVNMVIMGKEIMSYEELINEMIADAWYMVSEYKLNLGPSDTLEGLVDYVYKIGGLKSSETKDRILEFLNVCDDKVLKNKKYTLTLNVPYRVQVPFMEKIKSEDWKMSISKLIPKINQEKRLIYYFGELSSFDTYIKVQPDWIEYIGKNQEIIKGWIQYNLIIYLQRRNPSVPGIVNKLYPPQERKLNKIKQYWKKVIEISPVKDIYAGEIITSGNISIDHFVPWSYVAHDEFWNLIPTTRSVNSRKSNNLPSWNTYFPMLCNIEYYSYSLMWRYDTIRNEFIKCQKEHINSNVVLMNLYAEKLGREQFYRNLKEIVFPVYQGAKDIGFKEWKLTL